MARNKVNILCMKWGQKYDATYVNTLYSMVSRHLTLPFRFICLTDDTRGIQDTIECFPIPTYEVDMEDAEGLKRVQAWKKLTTFANPLYDIQGTCLFLDLDVVLIDNIDCFFEPQADFLIIHDWLAGPTQHHGNSSVYRFEAGQLSFVLEDFLNDRNQIVENYENEQLYLSLKIAERFPIAFWPETWCLSYRRHCLPKNRLARWFKPSTKPDEGKIVIFHGSPNPDEAIKGKSDRWYRPLKSAKWLGDYWRY